MHLDADPNNQSQKQLLKLYEDMLLNPKARRRERPGDEIVALVSRCCAQLGHRLKSQFVLVPISRRRPCGQTARLRFRSLLALLSCQPKSQLRAKQKGKLLGPMVFKFRSHSVIRCK